MEFTRDTVSAVTVRRVEPGAIRIGAETVTEDVLIFRDEVKRGISIDDVESLEERHLTDLLTKEPEIVILGTGWQAQRPPQEFFFALARRGIGFESMDTPAACRTFNILQSEGRDVAALLIVHD